MHRHKIRIDSSDCRWLHVFLHQKIQSRVSHSGIEIRRLSWREQREQERPRRERDTRAGQLHRHSSQVQSRRKFAKRYRNHQARLGSRTHRQYSASVFAQRQHTRLSERVSRRCVRHGLRFSQPISAKISRPLTKRRARIVRWPQSVQQHSYRIEWLEYTNLCWLLARRKRYMPRCILAFNK